MSPACSLVVSSLSVFLIYVVQTKEHCLLLSCVFSGVSVIAWNALDVVGTELYPTQLRYVALKDSASGPERSTKAGLKVPCAALDQGDGCEQVKRDIKEMQGFKNFMCVTFELDLKNSHKGFWCLTVNVNITKRKTHMVFIYLILLI